MFLALAVLFLNCVGFAWASPSLVTTPEGEISFEAGESCELYLGVDTLPEGLSGYNLTVELNDPKVAEIESVSFPVWAGMNAMSVVPASSVWLRAMDLQQVIEEGAENPELATLTLKGLKSGSTGITVRVSSLEDDSFSTIQLEGAEYSEEQETEGEEQSSETLSSGSKSGSSISGIESSPALNSSESTAENSTLNSNSKTSVDGNKSGSSGNLENEKTLGNGTGKSTENSTENMIPGFNFLNSVSIFVFFVLISTSGKLRK